MSITYNDSVSYSNPTVSYVGSLVLNVIGLNSVITLNNVTVTYSETENVSNYSTVSAFVDYNIAPTGVLTLTVTEDQAFTISRATIISVNTASAEVGLQQEQLFTTSRASVISTNSTSAEVEVEIVA
jgi:hypothetical protein